MAAGAGVLLLTSHAMAAAPLAASQPGFTLGDPITAILLGAFLFTETLQTSPEALTAEALGLTVLARGVGVLSRSDLITGPVAPQPRPARRRSGRGREGGARGRIFASVMITPARFADFSLT